MSDTPSDLTSIESLRADFRTRLAGSTTEAALKALHDEWLGRKSGRVTGLMKQLGSLAPEERRTFGAAVNALKTEIETTLQERRDSLSASRPPAGFVDVTLPGRELISGRIHPLMRVREQVEEIFSHM